LLSSWTTTSPLARRTSKIAFQAILDTVQAGGTLGASEG
jgi:hypothetical protein